ncbi:MAG: hypothetical protein RI941_621 [Pseudomonadota bacterium]
MTPHEKELLQKFLNELSNTSVQQKDSDAYTLITECAKKQPDALYLLVQRSMGLEMALQVAQKQMAELQSNSSTAKPASSFLSDNNAWGRQAVLAGAQAQARTGAQPSAWGSGMLGAIATTAIGVVAGSMLYQGIQSMMGQQKPEAAPGPLGQADTPHDMQQLGGQTAPDHMQVASNDFSDDLDLGGGFDDGGFA